MGHPARGGGVIQLGAPWMLFVAAPLALLVLARLGRLPSAHGGLRRRAIQGTMSIGALSAALALAQPELGRRVERLAVVVLLDESRSVAEEEGDVLSALRRSLDAMRDDDLAGLVVFGAEPATLVAPASRPSLGVARASIPRDGTDIAAAIRRGLAELPSGHVPRLLLVSDGAETQGDALAAAAGAAARGVAIDVWPIERAPSAEVAIERVHLPTLADPGQAVELRVVTRATQDTPVRVRVLRDGVAIAQADTEIRAGVDVLRLREVAPEPGVHLYEALLEPLDPALDRAGENNEGGALLRVTGGSRALVLASRPAEAESVAEALIASGIEAELGDARRVPADLSELASYDLIVLDDLPARAFTEAQTSELAAYVRDLGGGLWMAGARAAHGLGGYAFTPIEEVLPATFDLRRRRDRASLAMVIAIDKSGSMTVEVRPGTSKLALANEAAARSALLLSPLDRVAVAHIDTEVTWTQPMTAVEDPQRIAAVVRRAPAGGGGILVDRTLRAAYRALREQATQLKHLLLFSDGSDSEEMFEARRLVSDAARDGITTSVVSMGTGSDTPELEVLSRLGGGRFYVVEDMTTLPRVFTEETIAASRAALVTEPFRVVPRAAGAITRGIDFDAAPALGGHAVVSARPSATVLLGANDEDPLLVEHQHGVGRSAVWATDTGAALARSWLDWPGRAVLFGQLGRALARSPERRDAQVNVSLRGGAGHVVVEAVDGDGRTRNYLELGAIVTGPDGRAQRVPLGQTGAGRYEARFDAGAPGAYLVTVREGADTLVGSAGVVRARGDELRGEGTDHALLAQLAALTGGRVRAEPSGVFRDRPPPTYAHVPLWRPLVMLALAALLASVALRRLVLPWPRRRVLAAATEAGPTRPALAPPSPDRPSAEPLPAASSAGRAGEPVATTPAAPPETTPAAPSTLAEQLLARKKRR